MKQPVIDQLRTEDRRELLLSSSFSIGIMALAGLVALANSNIEPLAQATGFDSARLGQFLKDMTTISLWGNIGAGIWTSISGAVMAHTEQAIATRAHNLQEFTQAIDWRNAAIITQVTVPLLNGATAASILL